MTENKSGKYFWIVQALDTLREKGWKESSFWNRSADLKMNKISLIVWVWANDQKATDQI